MERNVIDVISNSFRQFTQGEHIGHFMEFLIQMLLLLLLFFLLYYLIHIGNNYLNNDKKIHIGKKQIFYFSLILVGIIIFIFIFRLRALLFEILSPFVFAMIFAYILNPVVKYLNSKGIERLWGVIIIYLSISFAILIISLTFIPKMVSEIRNLIELLPKYGNETYEYMYNLYIKYNRNIDNLPAEFDAVKDLLRINIARIQEAIFGTITSVTNILLNIFSKIIGLILIPVLAFYFLKDAEHFKRTLILLIPSFCRKTVLNIAKDIDDVLGGFIRGQLIVAALVGLLTTIALLILGVDFAVLVGFIAGIANIIPYFGPIIGIIPAVIFALLESPIKAIWVIVIFTGIQQIESAVLSPKIVGEKVGLHPVVVILALIIGGRFLGFLGLLIAIPIAAVIKVLGKHIVKYIVRY